MEDLPFDHNGMEHLPFGNPDGSKGPFEERTKEFIQLDRRKFPNGISATENSRIIRVVVGKKGAGKTLYLRRLQDSSRQEQSVFAGELTEEIPGTDSIVQFCQLFDITQIDEAWQKAWRMAIIRSCISYLTTKKYFTNEHGTKNIIKDIEQYKEIIPRYKVERTVYAELTDIITKHDTSQKFMKVAQSADWDDVQRILSNTLKTCPPVFFYLDGMDEEFVHAPMEWLRCQRGLYHAVMRLVRKTNSLGSRLHVVIAIRDSVYSSILTTNENRERHRNTPEVSLLDWGYKSINIFFREKIRKIPSDWGSYHSISDFAGVERVDCPSRNSSEHIEKYLLRHTRLLPRDIVQIGNEIAKARLNHNENGNHNKDRWIKELKSVVSRNARNFAEEQIAICANQLSSHDAPLHSSRHGYLDFYTSNQEYISDRGDVIKSYIKSIGKESFSYEEINAANSKFEKHISDHVKISIILWQNGLIGIKRRHEDPDFEFFSLENNGGFALPEDCHLYAFHPIVLDAISGIEVNLTIAPGGVDE